MGGMRSGQGWSNGVGYRLGLFRDQFGLRTTARVTVGTGDPRAYGTYFATLFRLKVRGGGVLGLLWTREDGNWRIVAYEVFEQ